MLIHMHEDQNINLRVVAISASERKIDWTYASNFADFKKKIAEVGLGNVEILRPIGYWGVTFWDWCLWTGNKKIELERKIHGILFPDIEFNYKEFCKKHSLDIEDRKRDRRWLNAKCNVLAL